jgi:hypothetical protein
MRWAGFLGIVLAGPAFAACPGETYLDCPVGKGRQLEVCVVGQAFTYRFGPVGRPELSLTVPMRDGTVTPWPGVGSAIWSSVRFPNADVEYEAWVSVERDPDGSASGGVTVLRGEETLVALECLPGSVTTPAFVLEDAMAAGGYCWDLQDFIWRPDGTCP